MLFFILKIREDDIQVVKLTNAIKCYRRFSLALGVC